MAKLQKKTDGFFYFKLTVALIFLVNPSIKTFDIFPDFISSLIIVGLIKEFCERAPGFSEARDAFMRLCTVSLIRLPAFIVVAFIRGSNTGDNDIVTLFTFVFAVFEGYLLVSAIQKLFQALFHIGMRGAEEAITPFSAFGKISIRPEALESIGIAFAIVRSVCYVLPEMILLRTSDNIDDPEKIFNAWALYPKVLTVCVIITLIFGAAVAYLFFKYIKEIKKSSALTNTLNKLYGEAERAEIEDAIYAKRLSSRIKLLIFSSVFTLDIFLESTDGIDVLPSFIYGIILFASISLLFDKSLLKKISQICLAAYIALAFSSTVMLSDFLSNYTYSSLIHKGAKKAFLPVLLSSGAEFALLCACMVLIGILLYKFSKKHTRIETFGKLSREKERKTKGFASMFAVFGSLTGLCKFLSYAFEYNQVSSEVLINGQMRVIATSLLPWFNTVSFAVALFFIFYSYYYLTSLSEDIELKYS